MRKAIAMGETVLDILFRHQQPFAAVPGGSSFNSAISMGRAGLPCTFVGYTGDDAVGAQIAQFMQDNDVDTACFEKRQGEKSAISLAYLDEQGDAHYTFYKDIPRVSPTWQVPSIQPDDVLLYGSYYAICQGMRPQVTHLLDLATQAGCIVYYDLNFRRSHLQELAALTPNILSNFRQSTIVRGSADDFEVVYGIRDAHRIYEKQIRQYCDIFICTSGAGHITICTPMGEMDFDTPAILHEEIVSTVGAGDSFNAGFIYGLIQMGITRAMLPTLGREQWQSLVDSGAAFAGQVCRSTDNYIARPLSNHANIYNKV